MEPERLASEFMDGYTPGSQSTVEFLAEAFEWLRDRSIVQPPPAQAMRDMLEKCRDLFREHEPVRLPEDGPVALDRVAPNREFMTIYERAERNRKMADEIDAVISVEGG